MYFSSPVRLTEFGHPTVHSLLSRIYLLKMKSLLFAAIFVSELISYDCFPMQQIAKRSSLKMALQTETEAPLSVAGRLNRAVSFYSAALPIFASYKLLDRQFKFQRETLGQKVSDEKVEEEFKKLHEWGSEILKTKIEDLKGQKVPLSDVS